MLVLRLNKSGMAQGGFTSKEAAKYYSQDRVLFELGDGKKYFMGVGTGMANKVC